MVHLVGQRCIVVVSGLGIPGTERDRQRMTQKSLADRLRLLRAQRGLTVKDAAQQVGVDRHTLRRIELGTQEAQYPTLAKIADGYSVAVEDLLEEPVAAGKAEAPEAGRPDEEEESAEDHRRRTYLVAHLLEVEKCADDAEELAAEFAETLSVGGKDVVVAERVGRLVQLGKEVHRRALTAEWLFDQLVHLSDLPEWERKEAGEIRGHYARLYAALSEIVRRIDAEKQAREVLDDVGRRVLEGARQEAAGVAAR
jgi:transcriptional regulator with XRE-family HTH domain